jgi:spore germination protein KC
VVLKDSEAVVIGLPLARQGIQQLMDQFVRLRESRRTQLLLVAEPTAQAVLRAFDPPLEVNLANAFENARYLQTITGLMPVLGLHNVLSAIESASGDAVAGLLAVQGAPMATGSPGAQPSTALPRTGPNPVNLIGAVAFAADRAVGVLSGRQTAILNLLRGDVLDVTLTVPDPFMPSRLDTLEVRPVAAPSVHVDTATPTPRIAESVPLELRLQSEMGLENYAARASSRRVLEAAALAVLEGQAATLVRTAQTQWRSDIFGFGDAARRNFATQGQLSDYDWARAFPRASVAVTFTAKTFQVGEQLQPPLPGD